MIEPTVIVAVSREYSGILGVLIGLPLAVLVVGWIEWRRRHRLARLRRMALRALESALPAIRSEIGERLGRHSRERGPTGAIAWQPTPALTLHDFHAGYFVLLPYTRSFPEYSATALCHAIVFTFTLAPAEWHGTALSAYLHTDQADLASEARALLRQAFPPDEK